jgi:hypothetical protein
VTESAESALSACEKRDKIYHGVSGIDSYMAPVTMPPVEEARAIFRRLGYEVSGNGPELLAERKWRTVRVTALGGDKDRAVTDGGSVCEGDYRFQCFVTWADRTGELVDRLRDSKPECEWAVIGVDGDGGDDYDVVRSAETPTARA